ncbi:autotransporter outer membrane beta-barrel domain-containing protein [Martelella soudanensis]|uniref:autotransporter outer membrane beta-barrel domain-containing protein n=1 Tax=unclassified Martelella TaxID=2629616 RepID=UPI0015DEDADA|nr:MULTISPECIES: autotransporter domain-containing protein [unclassified Martelella]
MLKFALKLKTKPGTSDQHTSGPLEFLMDTGSTGIAVDYTLLDDNKNLVVTDQRGWVYYNSTGLLAVGYIVEAEVEFLDAVGSTVTATVPILAVDYKACVGSGANSADCETAKNTPITMMGVGFGRNTLGEDNAAMPVSSLINDQSQYAHLAGLLDNAGQTSQDLNPLLHIDNAGPDFQPGYIINWDTSASGGVGGPGAQVTVTVGLTPDNTGGFAYGQLAPVADAEGEPAWTMAAMGVQLTNDRAVAGPQTGIFLADTGVPDSFVNTATGDPSAFYNTTSAGNVVKDQTSVHVQLLDAGDYVTLSYLYDAGCAGSPPPAGCSQATPNPLKWVGAHDGNAFLNTGLNFYRQFTYMFDPANGYLGLRPNNRDAGSGIVFTPIISAIGQIDFSSDIATDMPVYLRKTNAGNPAANATPSIAAASGVTATFNNFLAGPGDLVLNGEGRVVLNGANTYTGQTTVQSGTFVITRSSTSPVTVLASGNFELSGSLAGDVVNSGTTTVTGAIAGDVSNTGDFVNNGTVSGMLTSSGRLSGSGTVSQLAVGDNGTLATGNSIGTMTVLGDYDFGPAATREVEIGADGAIDLLLVGGTAYLDGGTVEAIGEDGFTPYLGAGYVFLHADGGIVGTHDTLEGGLFTDSLYPFLTTGLAYGANDAVLVVERSGVSYAEAGLTPNEIAVGAALDVFVAGSVLDLPLTHLTASRYQAAAGQLSGEIYASAMTTLQNGATVVRDTLQARLDGAKDADEGMMHSATGRVQAARVPGLGASAWIAGYGNWSTTDRAANTAELKSKVGGMLAGLDMPVSDWGRAGIAAGYGSDSFKLASQSASGAADSITIAAYGGGEFGVFDASLGASWSWHEVSVDRTISFPGYFAGESADYSATTGQIFAEAAFDLGTAPFETEAFGGLAYVATSTGSFSEGGDLTALAGGDETQANTLSTIGLRFARVFAIGEGGLRANATIGWQHAFGDLDPGVSLAFAESGAGFTVLGAPIARDAAVLALGFDFALTQRASLSLGYNGRIGGGVAENAAFAALSVSF